MFKVLKSGLYATVQDLGRFGFADSGVPFSGVMDAYSAKLANLLLGNDKNDAVIEVTFGGSSFQFLKNTNICLSGADLNADLNGQKISLNRSIKIVAGSILTFSKPNYGFRCYLAVAGGFLNKRVLGSRSYFKQVTKNYMLQKNDELLYREANDNVKSSLSKVKVVGSHFSTNSLDVFKGPEYELLSQMQKTNLSRTTFTISNEHSRMGYRLVETIENEIDSMLTSSTLPGTVQLTPSGRLIVLMRDCGVTGGYPRVLHLTDVSVNELAQKATGDVFQFNIVKL